MGLDNPVHIAFLLVVLLLVFGAKRLPEMGRSLGGGLREFKDSISGSSNDEPDRQIPPPAAPPAATAAAAPAPAVPTAAPPAAGSPVPPASEAPVPASHPAGDHEPAAG